jgi:lipoprotein-releasing system permease protein
MPWPVYLALKQLFPTGRVSFFTVISVIGVSLGVALLLVANSVMGGFGHQIRVMIIDTQGEVQVRARNLLQVDAAFEQKIAGVPGVAAFAPFAQGIVMVDHANHPAMPLIQGYDFERMKEVIPIEKYIIAGSIDDLDDDSVILSVLLADSLDVRIGDQVSVYTPLMLKRANQQELLLPRVVRVAGVFRVGHQQLDRSTMLCSLRLMQDLYGLRNQVHGYNVRIQPGANADEVAARLNAALPFEAKAMTWFESNADFQAVLSFERNMFSFLMSFIVIVAAFAIAAILLASVVRKTREIGLIAAMGGRARDLAWCFCIQGMVLGVAGIALGLAGGFTLLHFRDNVVRVITHLSMGQDAFVGAYQFTNLPANTTVGSVVGIVTFTLITSTLAGLVPAWRAARLKPVEALRSE